MNPSNTKRILAAATLLLLVTAACLAAGNPAGPAISTLPATLQAEMPTLPPEQQSVPPPSKPAQATSAPGAAEPTQQPAAQPTSVPPPAGQAFTPQDCPAAACVVPGSFLLARPVGTSARQEIDPSIRYGEYIRSQRTANHGSDFLNSSGTPVVAAADGTVVVAGDDSQTAYGLLRNQYGNLVVLEHHLPGFDQPVYTLYSHLSQIEAKEGQNVTAGEEIGQVGMTGGVAGSTLHFEVRVGENTYAAARNPELWLTPLNDAKSGQQTGALAGRILDAQGKPFEVKNIVLEQLGPDGRAVGQRYLQTYVDNEQSDQAPWMENFGTGDLPPGKYQVSFWQNGMQQQVIEIQPGQLTRVNFQVK